MQTIKMLSTKEFEHWIQAQTQVIIRYRQVEKSDILAEYNHLKQVVESAEFQAKKQELTTTRYADTQEGSTIALYKQLRWNKSVLLFNLFKKEALKEVPEVAKYLDLKELIQTPEFQQANAFWKNPKRWLTTPEGEQEQRYHSLAKHEDIIFFSTHTQQEVAELEKYEMVWAEEFEVPQLSDVWQTGFLYPTKDFKADHSHVVEQQAYTQGRNTQVANRVLTIFTKKQKETATAWHPTKGMISHLFEYTSDVWHTTQAVAPTTGVLQAKVRYSGKAKHAICLTTAATPKALHLLSQQEAKGDAIYTLVWNEKETINYINNVEVSRSSNTLSGKALHLVLRSYLPANQKAGTGRLDIDWIRIYTTK